VAVGAVCYVGAMLALDRGIAGEAREILAELRARPPA
jgi:hypothetical protein